MMMHPSLVQALVVLTRQTGQLQADTSLMGVLPYMVKLVAVDVFSHQKCAVHSMVLYWVSCV